MKIRKIKNQALHFVCLGLLLVVAVVALPGVFGRGEGANVANAQTLTVYKSPTCGCCANYIAYLKREGFTVKTVNTKDMGEIKTKYGVPSDMESCHTTVAGDGEYVIEGHIPVEAVLKLLEEKPAVQGIAMPGMPAGSPGMPGRKNGPFTIYKITDGAAQDVFLSL